MKDPRHVVWRARRSGTLKGTLRSFVGYQERALEAQKRGGGAHLITLEGALPSLEEEWNGLFGG